EAAGVGGPGAGRQGPHPGGSDRPVGGSGIPWAALPCTMGTPPRGHAVSRTLFRTRIKFCGFTRPGDVRLACELGADAIGFVFAGDSPRRIQPEEARAMRHALAPLVDAVALFMDNRADTVKEVVRYVRPSLLQFHGSEDDA